MMLRFGQLFTLGFVLFIITFSIDAQPTPPISYVRLSPSGEPEMVFDWTTDRCAEEDIPDLPARAFRDSAGQVQLIATHFIARRNIGPSLDDVRHECDIIAYSVDSSDPSQYSGKEWLASFYTEDGNTIYALQHNEFQGAIRSNWYNSITLAISTDGGASYSNIAPPPDHLVAASPYRYKPESGPYGVFEPGNMIRAEDGYIYTFVRIAEYKSDRQRVCLMRTNDLADPSSWRVWDGSGFDLKFPKPYTTTIEDPRSQYCSPIDPNSIGVMDQSLTYNTDLEQYVLVGASADWLNEREVWGVFYALSDDLINWSRRQLLMEVELPWSYRLGDDDPILYPSLIDPDSTSRNFETTDQTAYLYYTQLNYNNRGQMTLDRDLMRVPVQFDTFVLNAPEYELTLSGQVPDGATNATVGYRVNTECGCSGTADFSLYAINYQGNETLRNLVPNGIFLQNLNNWSIWGDGESELQPSNLTEEQMLDISVTTAQTSALNSAPFSVEAGTDYTVTFVASVEPTTSDAGYFTLIFSDAVREIQREQIQLVPNNDG